MNFRPVTFDSYEAFFILSILPTPSDCLRQEQDVCSTSESKHAFWIVHCLRVKCFLWQVLKRPVCYKTSLLKLWHSKMKIVKDFVSTYELLIPVSPSPVHFSGHLFFVNMGRVENGWKCVVMEPICLWLCLQCVYWLASSALCQKYG